MKIIIQPTAKKNLKKLPNSVREIILKKLFSIKDNPLPHIEKLKESALWKLRVGDYRCILFVHTGKEEVHILTVGHRKNIYKNLRKSESG
ncbi:MAG: type II toxin-antitoxin system RelE/ParE family toxin [Candidatus Woesearchaeota archaeon]